MIDLHRGIILCIYKFKKRGRKSLITKDLGARRPPRRRLKSLILSDLQHGLFKKNSICQA